MRLLCRPPRPADTHTPLTAGRNSYKNLLAGDILAGKYSYYQQKLYLFMELFG